MWEGRRFPPWDLQPEFLLSSRSGWWCTGDDDDDDGDDGDDDDGDGDGDGDYDDGNDDPKSNFWYMQFLRLLLVTKNTDGDILETKTRKICVGDALWATEGREGQSQEARRSSN